MAALVHVERLDLAFETIPSRFPAVVDALDSCAFAVGVPRLGHPDFFTIHR
jgi:hypothetical protein